jgi:hypothetical protein
MKKRNLGLFVAAWVLTLGGNGFLMDLVSQFSGLNPAMDQNHIFILAGVNILLTLVAGVFGFFGSKEKELRPMSYVVMIVSGLNILQTLVAIVLLTLRA